MQPVQVVVGLGANQGECVDTLVAASEALAKLGRLRARSRLYVTAPIGPAQPDFHNAAVLLETEHSLPGLLAAMLEIERRAGRVRRERWGPRLLDLDLLWARGQTHRDSGLEVPHPRLRERAFALLPLLDVAPDAADSLGPLREAPVLLQGQRCAAVDDARWQPGSCP